MNVKKIENKENDIERERKQLTAMTVSLGAANETKAETNRFS